MVSCSLSSSLAPTAHPSVHLHNKDHAINWFNNEGQRCDDARVETSRIEYKVDVSGVSLRTITLKNRLRRLALSTGPKVCHGIKMLRCRLDRVIDRGLQGVESRLNLTPERVEQYRMMTAKSLSLISSLAKLTTVPLFFVGSFAFPPALKGLVPLMITSLVCGTLAGAVARSTARMNLDNPGVMSNNATSRLYRIAQYMQLSGQHSIRLDNVVTTRSQLLVNIYIHLDQAHQTQLRRLQQLQQSVPVSEDGQIHNLHVEIEKSQRQLAVVENQLRDLLYEKVQRDNLKALLFGRKRDVEHGIEATRVKKVMGLAFDELIPLRSTPTQKGVIEWLLSDQYHDLMTTRDRIDICENLIVNPSPNIRDFADLISLNNQGQMRCRQWVEEGRPINLEKMRAITEEESKQIEIRQIDRGRLSDLLDSSSSHLVKMALSSLDSNQVKELLSRSPMDEGALKLESSIRVHLLLNSQEYGLTAEERVAMNEIKSLDFSGILNLFGLAPRDGAL